MKTASDIRPPVPPVRRTGAPVLSARRGAGGGKLLVPVGIGTSAIGAAGADKPLYALGVVAISILVFLPWSALFGAFVGSALGNRWGVQLGGSTLRGEEGVLVAFAIRAFLFTDRRYWPKLGLPEVLLAGFILINVLSTYFFPPVLPSIVAPAIL